MNFHVCTQHWFFQPACVCVDTRRVRQRTVAVPPRRQQRLVPLARTPAGFARWSHTQACSS